MLTTLLEDAIAALSTLDTEALERLCARAEALQAGGVGKDERERAEAPAKTLAALMDATSASLATLEALRAQEKELPWVR